MFIGALFIALIALAGIIFVLRHYTDLFVIQEKKTITSVKHGEEKVKMLSVTLSNGILKILKNETVTGWVVIAKYSEDSTPPSITVSKGELSVMMSNGILEIHLKTLSSISFDVSNGVVSIVVYGENCSITGRVINGNMNIAILYGNYSISLEIGNGNMDLLCSNVTISGSLSVSNGDISATIITNLGGKIDYIIENGDATITSIGYTVNVTKSNGGESGEVSCEGKGIALTISIGNGSLILVVIKVD